MVSTDNHLGYKETQSIRKNDSFEAFEEVLQKAKELNVDFLLLGGDLFHDLNPSQETLYKCLKILKEKIFGDKQIDYQTFWEDQAPNYSNENMNISLPIFIIHGNHDYPSNEGGNLSTLDLLHAGNYVNYFGKLKNYEDMEVKPILFHKKETRIALYGMGHIKDARLHYMLQQGRVRFVQPEEKPESYFHILVLHQNRYKGMKNWSYKNAVHPKMFPNFFNLIIWAHEHESIPDIEQSSEIQAYIYQPGSSVATSLIEAEGKPKHAGLFTFRKNEFYFEPIYLSQSERSIIYKQIELGAFLKKKGKLSSEETNDEVEKYLEGEIESLIKDFEKSQATQRKSNEKLPLVRLKIEYSGFDIIRIQRLETKFRNKVANEGDILKFWKKKPEFNEATVEKNENLTKRFSECFRNKTSFQTLGNDSIGDIRSMYEEDLRKKAFTTITPSLLLERMDDINIRNRQSQLTDFFENGLNQIKSQIFLKENQNLMKQLSENEKKRDEMLKNISLSIKNPQYSKENIMKFEGIKRDFEADMMGFVNNIQKNVCALTRNQINSVFKPTDHFIEEPVSESKKENSSKLQSKRRKKSPRPNEDEDKRSVSTMMSFNPKNNEMTLTEENNNAEAFDEDFQEDFPANPKTQPQYNINVITPNQPGQQEKGKRGRKKKEKSSEKEEVKEIKPKKSEKTRDFPSNQQKNNKADIVSEKNVKKEENRQLDLKSFYNDYLNPKKRKDETNILPKPEKQEKKEDKIMNAQDFLGALLDKKDGSIKKQRVFVGSPHGSKSKSKDQKSNKYKDFF